MSKIILVTEKLHIILTYNGIVKQLSGVLFEAFKHYFREYYKSEPI